MITPKFLDEQHLADMKQCMVMDMGQWKNMPDGKCALCKGAIDFPCYCNECYSFMCTKCYTEHLMDFMPAFDSIKLSDGHMRSIDLR